MIPVLIGPDYLPGHAHGDTFSFELSLRGQRILVDSGVCDYLDSPMRRYVRSTRAHNTVEIEGVDQSVFWGAFRVAERALPHDVLWKADDAGFSLQAWHDGYMRLPQKARHERRFDWSHTGRLVVYDQIKAQQPVSVIARLHLHPRCVITHQDEQTAGIDYTCWLRADPLLWRWRSLAKTDRGKLVLFALWDRYTQPCLVLSCGWNRCFFSYGDRVGAFLLCSLSRFG